MKYPKIAFIVGHRRSSQGAVGNLGISEYEFWSDFLKWFMQKNGNPPWIKIFYRPDGISYSVNIAIVREEVERWGADYCISCHFNAASNKSANGHEVLYSSKVFGSKKLAQLADQAFDNHLHNKDRNIVLRNYGNGGSLLRNSKMPTVIIEPFFAHFQHLYARPTNERIALLEAFNEIVDRLSNSKTATRNAPKYRLSKKSLSNLYATKNDKYIEYVEKAINVTQQDFSVISGGDLVPYPRNGNQSLVTKALTDAILDI